MEGHYGSRSQRDGNIQTKDNGSSGYCGRHICMRFLLSASEIVISEFFGWSQERGLTLTRVILPCRSVTNTLTTTNTVSEDKVRTKGSSKRNIDPSLLQTNKRHILLSVHTKRTHRDLLFRKYGSSYRTIKISSKNF